MYHLADKTATLLLHYALSWSVTIGSTFPRIDRHCGRRADIGNLRRCVGFLFFHLCQKEDKKEIEEEKDAKEEGEEAYEDGEEE